MWSCVFDRTLKSNYYYYSLRNFCFVTDHTQTAELKVIKHGHVKLYLCVTEACLVVLLMDEWRVREFIRTNTVWNLTVFCTWNKGGTGQTTTTAINKYTQNSPPPPPHTHTHTYTHTRARAPYTHSKNKSNSSNNNNNNNKQKKKKQREDARHRLCVKHAVWLFVLVAWYIRASAVACYPNYQTMSRVHKEQDARIRMTTEVPSGAPAHRQLVHTTPR